MDELDTERLADVESVSVWQVHEMTSLHEAWSRWQGFAMLVPGEQSRLPPPFVATADMPHEAWFRHIWGEQKDVHTLGVHFLRDVTITGQGYAFQGDRLLVQDAYLHNVALEELKHSPTFLPAASRTRKAIRPDRPVLELLGPGSPVYGHWLMDFLPRAAVARELLGDAFDELVLAIPSDLPGWTIAMLTKFTQFKPENIISYDAATEYLECARVVSPTFAHSGGGYFCHSFLRDFYSRFVPQHKQSRHARICLSRKNFEHSTRGVLKGFVERTYMEQAAAERGFEIVRPEELSFDQQIETFARAGIVVGEYGSALHNSLFSAPRTIVGAIRYPNSVQTRIAGLMGQSIVYQIEDKQWTDERGAEIYSVEPARIDAFLDQLMRLHHESFATY